MFIILHFRLIGATHIHHGTPVATIANMCKTEVQGSKVPIEHDNPPSKITKATATIIPRF